MQGSPSSHPCPSDLTRHDARWSSAARRNGRSYQQAAGSKMMACRLQNPRVEDARRRFSACSERLPSAARAGGLRAAQGGLQRGHCASLIQHEDGGLHKPSEGVGGEEDALQLGHEHADEGVQVAGPLRLVVPAELAAEHLRHHLDQLACGSTAQPLAGKKEGSGVTAKLTGKYREEILPA